MVAIVAPLTISKLDFAITAVPDAKLTWGGASIAIIYVVAISRTAIAILTVAVVARLVAVDLAVTASVYTLAVFADCGIYWTPITLPISVNTHTNLSFLATFSLLGRAFSYCSCYACSGFVANGSCGVCAVRIRHTFYRKMAI